MENWPVLYFSIGFFVAGFWFGRDCGVRAGGNRVLQKVWKQRDEMHARLEVAATALTAACQAEGRRKAGRDTENDL